ncbi:hypothetical protein QTP88_029191 [Uroleucon formosanum]
MKEGNNSYTFKCSVAFNCEDYYVIQHYKILKIQDIPSDERWKHAEASIKIHTSSRDTKDLIILNKINDVVTQHLETSKHIGNYKLKSNKEQVSQQFIQKSFTQARTNNQHLNEFNNDLTTFMVANDIPLWKLKNAEFNNFFEKYIKLKLPDESTVRKNYVPLCYEDVLRKIRKEIGNSSIWVSIDETIDVQGRYVASVIIGSLSSENLTKPIVLTVEHLEKTNFQTISKLFNDSMSILWPEKVLHDKVLLYVTDAAPYMEKSGHALKVFYPKLIHITYMAHGLHRLSEAIRDEFSNVDLLISNTKKVFLKAPSRVAFYYGKNFDKVKEVIDTFNPNDAKSIQNAQQLFNDNSIKNELSIILSNFQCITDTITCLEKSGINLGKSLELVQNVENKLSEGGRGIEFSKVKLSKVLSKNPGLSQIKKISEIISGEIRNDNEDLAELSPEDISCFKYAPIVSADVERSFSKYKEINTEKYLKTIRDKVLLNKSVRSLSPASDSDSSIKRRTGLRTDKGVVHTELPITKRIRKPKYMPEMDIDKTTTFIPVCTAAKNLSEFINTCDISVKSVDKNNLPLLIKIINSKLAGNALEATKYRDTEKWEDIKSILKGAFEHRASEGWIIQ